MGGLDGGGRVLDLGGRDVARLHALLLRLFQERLVRLALDVHGDCTVVRLRARGPGGARRGGIRDVVRLAVLIQGVVRVLAGHREGVDALEETAGALGVVAGDGDLGITHAVADKEDDVLRAGLGNRVPHELRLVAGEAAGATVGGEVALGFAVRDVRVEVHGLGGVGSGHARGGVIAAAGAVRGAIGARAADGEDGSGAEAQAELEHTIHGLLLSTKQISLT